MSALSVYFETRLVGRIDVGADGPSFMYDPTWLETRGAFPLSVTMSLSPHPVPPDVFLPWASNLLPEGQQLKTIGSRLGASGDDVVEILRQIGRDTAGALSIGKPGTASTAKWKPVETEADLERVITELPRKPFLVGDEGVSMSLAGVQSKLAVAIDDEGRICIPLDGAPSTHILKPDSDSLYGGVQNEALCLALARRCGLNAAEVTTGKAGKRTYLLVTRYDRQRHTDRVRRLHQEDYCQALGRPPSAKYEANQTGNKGPTLSDMFALTRSAMIAADTIALLDAVIFNVLMCNTDAHAKNYSLMITGKAFTVAPIYDVMCADVWEGVTKNLAQTIAGKNRGAHLKHRHWLRMAEDCGLNPTRLVARVEGLAAKVMAELDQAVADVKAMPAGGHGLLADIHAAISKRCRAIIGGLADKRAGTGTAPLKSLPAPPFKNAAATKKSRTSTTTKAKSTKKPNTAK
jgi:serine/threonine-protein kinase HipA